jgi:hypothetical protein
LEKIISWIGKEDKQRTVISLVKDIPFPIDIIYDHAGGNEGYLKIDWYQNKDGVSDPVIIKYFHSPAQKQKMHRISILQ